MSCAPASIKEVKSSPNWESEKVLKNIRMPSTISFPMSAHCVSCKAVVNVSMRPFASPPSVRPNTARSVVSKKLLILLAIELPRLDQSKLFLKVLIPLTAVLIASPNVVPIDPSDSGVMASFRKSAMPFPILSAAPLAESQSKCVSVSTITSLTAVPSPAKLNLPAHVSTSLKIPFAEVYMNFAISLHTIVSIAVFMASAINSPNAPNSRFPTKAFNPEKTVLTLSPIVLPIASDSPSAEIKPLIKVAKLLPNFADSAFTSSQGIEFSAAASFSPIILPTSVKSAFSHAFFTISAKSLIASDISTSS